MERDQIYADAEKLYNAMSVLSTEQHKELCEILGYTYTSELFDDLMLALVSLSYLLKTYRELQEVSK